VDDSPTDSGCPYCGGEADRPCSHCGGSGSTVLRVVARSQRPQPDDASGRVRLLREYKGPTVQELMASPEPAADLLPGRVHSTPPAISQGAPGFAAPGSEMATVLRGPGFGRRRTISLILPAILWLWFGLLLCLVVWIVS